MLYDNSQTHNVGQSSSRRIFLFQPNDYWPLTQRRSYIDLNKSLGVGVASGCHEIPLSPEMKTANSCVKSGINRILLTQLIFPQLPGRRDWKALADESHIVQYVHQDLGNLDWSGLVHRP